MSEQSDTTNLEPVLISPVVSGMIRTWSEDETRLWSIDNPEGLAELLGRGRIARTMMPDNRSREIAFLDTQSGTLSVQPRFASADNAEAAGSFQLGEPIPVDGDPWDELELALAHVALSAAARSEFWLVEQGGWDAPAQPHCLFAVISEDGAANAVMEAAPAPADTGVWPEVPSDQPGVSVAAPASQETIEAAGIFATTAIQTWNVHPWDVGLTFGKLEDFA